MDLPFKTPMSLSGPETTILHDYHRMCDHEHWRNLKIFKLLSSSNISSPSCRFLFCCSIDPTYLKAYYRRGSANYALGKLREALKDFKHVAILKPKDEDAVKKMKVCEREMKAELFTKAIESDVTVSLMSQADIAKIVVEASYDGPNLSEKKAEVSSSGVGAINSLGVDTGSSSPVSMQFVHEVVAHFKNQKVLHRK